MSNSDRQPGNPIYDPRDPAVIDNPLPALKHLQKTDPVHYSPHLRGWVITGHDDIRQVLANDADISADRLTPFYASQAPDMQQRIETLIRYLNTWVAFKDPPDHTRLRKLMNQVFTRGAVRELKPMIQRAVDGLLDGISTRTEIDFIADFAYPLPATVIMEMLALPLSDMESVKSWSRNMQMFIGSSTNSAEKYRLAADGAVEMADYFRRAIRQRAEKPGDDMISKLLALREQGEAITEDEVVGTSMLFLFGGHETTTNLIGNGVRALLQHPDQLQRLRNDPELIQSAVEEILRFDGPTGATVRVVKQNHEFHGVSLKAGDRVFAMINAANHDDRVFDHPEQFRIDRHPNLHLTFNYGRHFCLGAPLARLEGMVAIDAVIRRFPNMSLAADHYRYMDTLVMRGVSSMPVRLR